MLVWLASYPRSGNTLTRAILHQVFALPVPSVYPEGSTDSGEHDWGPFVPRFEHPEGLTGEPLVAWARAQPELYVMKTHELPDGAQDPAIILVRDGRAAMASYERYTQTWWKTPRGLEEVVVGDDQLVNWSDWHHAWGTRSAPTLTLYFEAVAESPNDAAAEIGRFLKLKPERAFGATFEQMQAINPRFFQVGSNGPGIAAVESRCPNLFWALHGDHMRHFGYGGADADRFPDQMSALRELAATINAQKALKADSPPAISKRARRRRRRG